MNELIVIQPKQIGNEEINSVDARELHRKLGVQKKFADWIKYNIEKLHLVEGTDFTTYSQNWEKGRPTDEYILTLDAGKHIAMMTNTDTAHSIRTYFIEFEKRAKALPVVHDPQTRALIQLLAEQDAMKQEQKSIRHDVTEVQNRLAAVTPIHSMSVLNTIQGAIQTAAKWYRAICGVQHVPVKTNEAVVYITTSLLEREGVQDIGYIRDASAALKYLRKLASNYKEEYDKWIERNSLFRRAA